MKAITSILHGMSVESRSEIFRGIPRWEALDPSGIINSITEIVHHRIFRDREHEAVRSPISSACCGPQVNLTILSRLLGIYENRNAHKLQKYRYRREDYITGKARNMSGEKYSSDCYGFPLTVMNFMRDWYEDDDCSTPDK